MTKARALAVYSLLTVAATWPLAARLHIMDPGDSAFFAWILGWTLHALFTDPLSLPHANIYHPARWALGMDEPIVGTSILALPLVPFTDDAVLMLNVVRLATYVLSAFGVMFTPNQKQAAQELLRVCRPGGTIGLANWTPEGFIGQVFRTIGKYVPPPAGLKPPALWGTEQRLRELFGEQISELSATRRMFVFRYRSAEHWLHVFRTYYGPVLKAFAALDAEGQAGLARDLTEVLERYNQGGSETLAVPGEYLEVVATRR